MNEEVAALIARSEGLAVSIHRDHTAIVDWAEIQPLWVQRAFLEMDPATYAQLSTELRDMLHIAWPLWGVEESLAA